MIFNSFTYILFLALAVILYWNLSRLPRLVMLLVASIIFYGFWRFDFVILLLASVIIDYFLGILISDAKKQSIKRILMLTSVMVNLGTLAFFKYFYFISTNSVGLANWLGYPISMPTLNVLLPIGISFYIFQTMSYTIDVYRGFIKPCRDFLLFANFVIYFPQLIAGPILRAGEVIWQLDVRPAFSLRDIGAGVKRIVAGLFLKVVLADNIAGFVDDGYSSDLDTLSAIDVLTLAFLFGFQIYFDFSAYSHIAIGSARLMGLHFPENFRYPYSAVSPRDFWNRWHISLSSWIRDYLYLPLTGAMVEDRSTGGLAVAARPAVAGGKAMFALFATWGIMGLWHGAAWAFVLWGGWHACFIALYRFSPSSLSRLPKWLSSFFGWGITLLVVMLAWIPFRVQSVPDTLMMWGKLLEPAEWGRLGLRENFYLVAGLTMASIMLAPYVSAIWDRFEGRRSLAIAACNLCFMVAIIALILIYIRPLNQFIYFQF